MLAHIVQNCNKNLADNNNNSNLQNNNENVNNENVSESEIENEFRRIQGLNSGLSAEEYELFRARDKGFLTGVRQSITKMFQKQMESIGSGNNDLQRIVKVNGQTFREFFKTNKIQSCIISTLPHSK